VEEVPLSNFRHEDERGAAGDAGAEDDDDYEEDDDEDDANRTRPTALCIDKVAVAWTLYDAMRNQADRTSRYGSWYS
jgi:hypothetical protein